MKNKLKKYIKESWWIELIGVVTVLTTVFIANSMTGRGFLYHFYFAAVGWIIGRIIGILSKPVYLRHWLRKKFKGEAIIAPWTAEQVELLNQYQREANLHPYTCGGNRVDEKHLDGEEIMIATKMGWKCPYCGYRQYWALNSTLYFMKMRKKIPGLGDMVFNKN